jgi:hypothetical protein
MRRRGIASGLRLARQTLRSLRPGIQAENELLRRAQRVIACARRGLQAREIPLGEQFQVMLDDVEGELADRLVHGALAARFTGRCAARADLQRQALGRRAGTDARRVEILQVAQRNRQLVQLDVGLGCQQCRDVLEALRQVSVLVKRVDQHRDKRTVAFSEIGKGELGVEMIAQRRRVRRAEATIAFLVVVRAPGHRRLAGPGVRQAGFGACIRVLAWRGGRVRRRLLRA